METFIGPLSEPFLDPQTLSPLLTKTLRFVHDGISYAGEVEGRWVIFWPVNEQDEKIEEAQGGVLVTMQRMLDDRREFKRIQFKLPRLDLVSINGSCFNTAKLSSFIASYKSATRPILLQ